MPPSAPDGAIAGGPRRVGRWSVAVALVVIGGTLIALAKAWRGVEATLAAAAISVVTQQETMAVPARHLLILYKDTSVQSAFVLTSECSVAYLLAAFLVGSAPLMLLQSLSPWRTLAAVAATTTTLIAVNTVRLTAIGATVSEWGTDPGLEIAHTYLGSVVTVFGACAAGVAFAAVLVTRRNPTQPAVA